MDDFQILLAILYSSSRIRVRASLSQIKKERKKEGRFIRERELCIDFFHFDIHRHEPLYPGRRVCGQDGPGRVSEDLPHQAQQRQPRLSHQRLALLGEYTKNKFNLNLNFVFKPQDSLKPRSESLLLHLFIYIYIYIKYNIYISLLLHLFIYIYICISFSS